MKVGERPSEVGLELRKRLAMGTAAGTALGVYNEAKGKKLGYYPTGEERDTFFIFSPFLSVEEAAFEQILLVLFALKLSKTPEGLTVLKELGIQYLKTLGKVLEELAYSSASGWLVALINSKLNLRICRRLGLMTANEAATLESSYNSIFIATIVKEGIVDSLGSLGSMFKGLGALVPAPTS